MRVVKTMSLKRFAVPALSSQRVGVVRRRSSTARSMGGEYNDSRRFVEIESF
jgi:hypothetical protein